MSGRRPFDTVLVANRGEIAVRIQRSVRELGMRSVAVYSEADRHARHVAEADQAVLLGPAPAAQSYLSVERTVAAAVATGAQAVHPGYGLLSESAELAEACEASGLTFIGPTAAQLRAFGLKHTARQLAHDAGVPLVPGTGLLGSADEAVAAADAVGYPVMLKASAGGGGIGMRRCGDAQQVRDAFTAVTRLADANFGQPGVFLERFIDRARHVEVQVFGDGAGRVVTLGERDCSAQRRHQKVLEETPAPGLDDELRRSLADHARRLAASVGYRSAGTVEFVVDADTGEAWFLEVNTRLQVEHGVTELTHGIDLVAWMIRLAAGDPLPELDRPPCPVGAAIEARIYAEDPAADFRPSAGLITDWHVPDGVRCDGWVEAGTEVTPYYDPLLAKVLVHAPDRAGARAALARALEEVRVAGVETNLGYLRHVVGSEAFASGRMTTTTLASLAHAPATITVEEPGTFTTVQDLPGRLGFWHVGVPPSGPSDDRSFALANVLVGNPAGAAALEATITGPTLRFGAATAFVLGGAEMQADLDGAAVPWWTVVEAEPGSVLRLGAVSGAGSRTYLAVAGGLDVPAHLGSRSTFVLGGFGGHGGRTLRSGDVLHLGPAPDPVEGGHTLPPCDRPELTHHWQVGVLAGPHGAPDFFTSDDQAALYGTDWEVHFNSDRTGVRLIGPRPTWARADGGEAGLHPSNIHDTPYAVGTVDFTGDMPIILGRDGPSLGGFVCPATVATDELWKVGQARAGDTIRFVPVRHGEDLRTAAARTRDQRSPVAEDPVLHRLPAAGERPDVTYRRDGDRNVLLEYGPNVLDVALRLRVGALAERLEAERPAGVEELTPGIRSLQVRFDPARTDPDRLVADLVAAEGDLPALDRLVVPSRVVHLPLSWDDPATRQATEKYARTVRADAPWLPWNLEFIRRINGLASVEDVKRIVFDADYLVLGLGDVYLGAPVATPVDPRHRLVTTKYNPARTWTAENSVGIGGAYLCVYGMEGPGGYQFVGRTVQVWNRWRRTPDFPRPWLLRCFDQIRWYEVDAEELAALRRDVPTGRYRFRMEETEFALADHRRRLDRHRADIDAFTTTREAAFAAERARWEAAGLTMEPSEAVAAPGGGDEAVPDGAHGVRTPVSGVVWKVVAAVGDRVAAGDPVVVVEAMKMETEIRAPRAGRVAALRCGPGDTVTSGRVVAVLEEAP